jgi:hypothetical protein
MGMACEKTMLITNEFLTAGEALLHEASVKIVIAYEDQRALARADELRYQLVRRCQGEVQIKCSAWNFALLSNPRLRKWATTEAVEAEMIIIAANGASELPLPVHSWITRVVAEKSGGPAALVTLLEPAGDLPDEQPGLVEPLRRMAEANGLDFFCNLDAWYAGSVRYWPDEHWNRLAGLRESNYRCRPVRRACLPM